MNVVPTLLGSLNDTPVHAKVFELCR